uniref:MAK10-like protein n=1 Tax=Tanacetum cinerariifolium TaxID=118510 RepID=A0A6L2KZ72_TANCI|nr:MAK10-like protein [Tanacetum cinerariifolium]
MGDENPIRTLGDYSRPSYEGFRNTIKLLERNNMAPLRSDTIRISIQSMDSFQGLTPKSPSSWHRSLAPSLNFYDHINPVTRQTIDQSAGGKFRDLNPKESWAILEDLAIYDNKSWNDPRDFAKPVKEIALPQDVPSTSDRRLIGLENQVQRLMLAHLAPTQPTHMNKITTPCEISSGPYDTQYCMENPKQAFVEYASSRTDEAGDGIGAKPPYYARKDFIDCHLPEEWGISRDAELNPFKDTLVFRRMVEFLGAIPINLTCNM